MWHYKGRWELLIQVYFRWGLMDSFLNVWLAVKKINLTYLHFQAFSVFPNCLKTGQIIKLIATETFFLESTVSWCTVCKEEFLASSDFYWQFLCPSLLAQKVNSNRDEYQLQLSDGTQHPVDEILIYFPLVLSKWLPLSFLHTRMLWMSIFWEKCICSLKGTIVCFPLATG